ncbi:hypothetical protein C2857_002257 [Epichloe festucae Fl1]|uniref:Ubiquitin 3 binding protein But2 C-terminal domain-containing protein n=1 Tax=Epichloe festucae (strain Fl1) TaxID=877507 RepID=A0A7U3Q034_EPIFF|nr:hypothetical protein C2857_002257 [Epichloe festucae Fl1]
MAPYEFPCFIVTVDNSSPDKAAGASYFGESSSFFPDQSQLDTSSYTFSGDGKIDFSLLNGPASTSTNNKPGKKLYITKC